MAEEKQSDDTLRQEIVEQSKREADSIVQIAEKDAQLILEKARKEADKILKEAEHKADAWKEQIRRRTFSSVKLEIQKQSLRQREKLIGEILDRVRKRLLEFRNTDAYETCIRAWIEQGAEALGTDTVQILAGDVERKIMDKKRVGQLESDLKKKLGRDVKLEILSDVLEDSGIVLKTPDGRMRLDNRLSMRMKRLDENMRLIIMKQFIE